MSRIALCIAALLLGSLTSAFVIQEKTAINWPFNVCGQGPWKMTALTLSAQPSRNTNCTSIAVQVYPYLDWNCYQLYRVRSCYPGCQNQWSVRPQ